MLDHRTQCPRKYPQGEQRAQFSNSSRSVTTTSAHESAGRHRPRLDHSDNQAESARRPAATPAMASSTTTARPGQRRAIGRPEKRVRRGLTRKVEFTGDQAIHAHLEQVEDAHGPQHLLAVVAR